MEESKAEEAQETWPTVGKPRRARKTIPSKKELPGRLPVGYVCKSCMIIFNDGDDYAEHNLVFHDPRDSQGSYVCSLCGKLFKRCADLWEHEEDHKSVETLEALEFNPDIRKQFGIGPKKRESSVAQWLDNRAKEKCRLEPSTSGSSLIENSRAGDFPSPPKKKRPKKAEKPTVKKPVHKMKASRNYPVKTEIPDRVVDVKDLARKSSASSTASSLGPPSPALNHPPPTAPTAPGCLSQCPRCQMQFQSAWIMLEHATTDHGARLIRLEKRIFPPESDICRDTVVFEEIRDCKFCDSHFTEDYLCLLHIVREHRNGKGLYSSPDWAGKVMVTTDVVYRPEDDASELKFKINVTLKVKKPGS